MKEKNRVIVAAWVMLALLGAVLAASSALTLWGSQYVDVFGGGLLSVKNMEAYADYMQVMGIQDTLEALCLLVGVIAYPILLTCHVMGKKPLSHKQKWVYVGVTAATLLLPSLVMGLFDTAYGLWEYYLLTPAVLVGVLVVCVVLEYGLKALQKRKDKQK